MKYLTASYQKKLDPLPVQFTPFRQSDFQNISKMIKNGLRKVNWKGRA